MDDLINRQAVLEMAYDMSEIDGEHFTEPCMVVDVEDIQKLSPVKQESKWIPVSERLPEFTINNTVSEDVLVFDGVDIRVGEYRKVKYLNGAGYWRVYGYDLEEYVDVIAWMPLPEPYKAESEE